MEKVYVVVCEYYDFSTDVSVSCDVCETMERAKAQLEVEKDYTLDHFKDCEGSLDETETHFTYQWDNGYYSAWIVEKYVLR